MLHILIDWAQSLYLYINRCKNELDPTRATCMRITFFTSYIPYPLLNTVWIHNSWLMILQIQGSMMWFLLRRRVKLSVVMAYVSDAAASDISYMLSTPVLGSTGTDSGW